MLTDVDKQEKAMVRALLSILWTRISDLISAKTKNDFSFDIHGIAGSIFTSQDIPRLANLKFHR